jgi:hypothetical protein
MSREDYVNKIARVQHERAAPLLNRLLDRLGVISTIAIFAFACSIGREAFLRQFDRGDLWFSLMLTPFIFMLAYWIIASGPRSVE